MRDIHGYCRRISARLIYSRRLMCYFWPSLRRVRSRVRQVTRRVTLETPERLRVFALAPDAAVEASQHPMQNFSMNRANHLEKADCF